MSISGSFLFQIAILFRVRGIKMLISYFLIIEKTLNLISRISADIENCILLIRTTSMEFIIKCNNSHKCLV